MLDVSAIEALLFDLDGTLLDSDDHVVENVARWLRPFRPRDPEGAARHMVMTLETPANAFMTALDVVGLDGPLTGLTDQMRRWRGLRTPSNFLLVEGTDHALHVLSGHYRLGVVTTRGRRDADAFLTQFELTDLFEVVVTRETTWRLKPHPAPVRHAVQEMGLAPEQCAMVGDTTVDMRAARQAGAWAIAVLSGFGTQFELEQAGAHVVLPSPAYLPATLGLTMEK